MVWKITDGDAVAPIGKMFTTKGIKIPPTWNSWTDDNKKKHGLYWEDDPVVESFDRRFYWSKDNPKNLDDVDAKDSDGNQLYKSDGKTKVITTGLKSQWIVQTKRTANDMLAKTDWMVTRKMEKGDAIPTATATFRDSVRTACDTIETKINNCSKLSEFMALFDVPKDSDDKVSGNAPIYDFPKET
jgi:hypothetical protein